MRYLPLWWGRTVSWPPKASWENALGVKSMYWCTLVLGVSSVSMYFPLYLWHLFGGIIKFKPASLKVCFSLKMCRSPLLFGKVLECAFNLMSMAPEHELNWSWNRLTVSRWVMDSYQTQLCQFIYTSYWFLQVPTWENMSGVLHRQGCPLYCSCLQGCSL